MVDERSIAGVGVADLRGYTQHHFFATSTSRKLRQRDRAANAQGGSARALTGVTEEEAGVQFLDSKDVWRAAHGNLQPNTVHYSAGAQGSDIRRLHSKPLRQDQ